MIRCPGHFAAGVAPPNDDSSNPWHHRGGSIQPPIIRGNLEVMAPDPGMPRNFLASLSSFGMLNDDEGDRSRLR